MNYTLKQKNIFLNDNGVTLLNGQEKRTVPWKEISYTVEKKSYEIYYSSKGKIEYALKEIYKFYKGEEFLFCLDTSIDKDEIIKSIKVNFIDTNTIKKIIKYIDGQETIELRYIKGALTGYIMLVIMYIAAFIMIGLLKSLDLEIDFKWAIPTIIVLSVPLAIISIIKEIAQKNTKVYLIKGNGIGIEKGGQQLFYSFKEIDEGVTECYLCKETVDNKIRLYKDNKKILEVTNSYSGFYEFLDELKLERIIK